MAETIIAKIQVRRGELEYLPALDEGEFGYALDYHRLFIGNTPLEFVADGVTNRFTLQTKSIVPGQTKVLVDGNERTQYVEYNFEDTDIVFAEAPTVDSVIRVSFNTELSVVNAKESRDRIVLDALADNNDTTINWSLLNYNSASIEYSLKNSAGAMNIGTLKVITNGVDASVIDLGGGIGDSGISFDARINNGRVYVTYTNTSEFSANLFYSIRFWNTI
jgi:hypothetical protein